ncbi:MAG: cobalamin-binding protein [Oligoflexia bacterium]|nr:cobalamin-binding protein [Oligoflexia bacterium]
MKIPFLSAALGLALSLSVAAAPVTNSPPAHAARIVTLAPSLGEIAADLAGNGLSRIVGVTEYTDVPPGLKKVKSIGSYVRVNLEAVAALKPDLVLATMDGNSKDQVTHLQEMGIPVVIVKSVTLADIEQSITQIAHAMGEDQQGQVLVARFRAGVAQIRSHAQARKFHPSVLFELSDAPLIVAGRGTFLNDAIELVGAKNVFADLALPYPRPGAEEAVQRNPDVIIVGSEQEAEKWRRFPQLKAVANRQVKVVRSDALLRPSPSILRGIVELERAIFPH